MSRLSAVIFIALLVSTISVFGQTSELTGTVFAISSSTIILQSGTDVWDIKRTKTTTVNGTLKVGSTVTVKYSTVDGQKREGTVTGTNPTPTPAGQ